MNDRVKVFRAKAIECAALAVSARDAGVRLAYEKLVEHWNDLADRITRVDEAKLRFE